MVQEYLAPELLVGKGYGLVVDWWTLGVLLFEMLVGTPPFYSEDQKEMYSKILHDPLVFPADIEISPNAKSLIEQVMATCDNRFIEVIVA